MRTTSTRRFWLVLLVLVALSAAYTEWRGLVPRYIEYTESTADLKQLREQVEAARREEARLEQRVQDLKENRVEQEASIRRAKNLVRPGETVYRIETAL